MYRKPRASRERVAGCNLALVLMTALVSTATTAYVLKIMSAVRAKGPIGQPLPANTDNLDVGFKERRNKFETINETSGVSWDGLLEEASEVVGTKLEPDKVQSQQQMDKFRKSLASMSTSELLAMLKLIQDKVASKSMDVSREKAASKASSQFTDQAVVMRSDKMKQLIGVLESVEASASEINFNILDKLASVEKDKPIVSMKPSLLVTIMGSKKLQGGDSARHSRSTKLTSWPTSDMKAGSIVLGGQDQLDVQDNQVLDVDTKQNQDDQQEEHHDTADYNKHDQGQQPQQEIVVDDWMPPASPMHHHKKHNYIHPEKSTTTSTTTTTTTTSRPTAPMTTQKPAHKTIEEVWIEQEDVYQPPPKKKFKKYKKKSVIPVTTTTTSTTTTTTTTTRAPTTTTEEAWHEEEITYKPHQKDSKEGWQWEHHDSQSDDQGKHKQDEHQEQDHQGQHQNHEAPGQQPQVPQQGQGKVPEDDWIDAVRADVQNRFNIVYLP